jgi:hypothetical protein
MPDSNSTSSQPPKDASEKNMPPVESELPGSDDAIDLGDIGPDDDGTSAVSFSSRGEKKDGGSGSGVRSWEQLVQEASAQPPATERHDAIQPVEAIDPETDKDLLKEVLADEPPPSTIILKDPSHGETPALPKAEQEAKAGRFELPPELAATSTSDPSILHQMPPPGGSGILSGDVWGSSSRVDLARPVGPGDLSSESLGQGGDLHRQLVAPASGGSSESVVVDAPVVASGSSSAVDLGAGSSHDLPFPLGVDSSVGSQVKSGVKPPSGLLAGGDSGAVDLLTADEEFELPESAPTPGWAAREVLPPTVPMVTTQKARLMAWAGGGSAGLLLGVGISALLWFTGVVPNQRAKPTTGMGPTAVAPAAVDTTGEWQAKLQSAEEARTAEASKAAAAADDARKARNELTQANAQIKAAQSAAAEAKQARERADTLAAQIKQIEAAQAALKDSVAKLNSDKASADAKVRESVANLTVLRNQLAQSEADARTARERSDEAEASRKQSAAFAADVARRINWPPATPPADLLAALDRALTNAARTPQGVASENPPTNPPRTLPPAVTANAVRTPEQARLAVSSGLSAFRSGNYAASERDLARLAASSEANAVHLYYLGLAKWHQGRWNEAEEDFRRGWTMERQSQPPPAEVEAWFERLDRSDREAVNRFRHD